MMRNLIPLLYIVFFSFKGISQTQAEMNAELQESYNSSDEELNAVYQAIIREYKNDTIFLKALRFSQRNWIKFRASELKMKYPERKIRGYYGSVYPMCEASYLDELTKSRIKTLKVWLDGIEEGDVCSGSVKIARE
ncbi:MAG: lysozyme inhibitor LprI family protein [Bacteroidota bacterium]|nr:lysozyme inhibitor LprI family protein [Bacteroidota bacterium]